MEKSLSEKFSCFTNGKLLNQLREGSALYRGHALEELIRRSVNDVALQKLVLQEIDKPENKSMKVFGIISVSYLGIAELIRHGDKKTKSKIFNTLESWDYQEKKDLLWFLNSESLINDLSELKDK